MERSRGLTTGGPHAPLTWCPFHMLGRGIVRLLWPKGGPPLVWKIQGLGEGYSSPRLPAAALASSWFRNPNRFPCSEAVQDIRAEVDSIGPDDRPRFGVHPDLFEKFHILQRTEDPAAAGNPSSQVDLARSPVGETQLQAVLSGVPDPLYAWKHNNLLIQRPDPLRRLLIVQAVPVPKQFALM